MFASVAADVDKADRRASATSALVQPTVTEAATIFHKTDLEFARNAASNNRIPVFQIDPEDLQLVRHSSLMPVIVVVKIPYPEVLSLLLKEAGDGKETVLVQEAAAGLLLELASSDFDLILNQSKLSLCCLKLGAFVDMHIGESLHVPNIPEAQ
jgi:hypothetical protein